LDIAVVLIIVKRKFTSIEQRIKMAWVISYKKNRKYQKSDTTFAVIAVKLQISFCHRTRDKTYN